MKRSMILIFLFIFTSSYAVTKKNAPISEEVEDEKDINLRVFAKTPIQSIIFGRYVNNNQIGEDIKYEANTTMDTGIEASYQSFGASITLSSESLMDEKKFGKSESRDYQFYFYTDHFGADLYYQKYKGYFLSEPETFGYKEGDPLTLRPDIFVKNIGTNIYYSFSDDYSLSASFKQMEKSYKSAGSWLVSLSINEFEIKGDSSLIPLPVQSQFGDFSDYRGGKYRSISAGGGYGYLHVFTNDFYLGGALMVGIGYMYMKEDLGSTDISSNTTAINVNLKISAGYNGETFYCGLTGFGFANGTSKSSTEYTNISCYGGEVAFFAGIRL